MANEMMTQCPTKEKEMVRHKQILIARCQTLDTNKTFTFMEQSQGANIGYVTATSMRLKATVVEGINHFPELIC